MPSYAPTKQQQEIIDHAGAAFVTACPGAGKTRTMVERARQLLSKPTDRRGVAFLSFTNAAVDELEARLRAFGILPSPLFPSFIGTFDRFLWQFLITPFGIPGCDRVPKLIPDKSNWEVKPPYDGAQPLSLRCFDRATGKVDPALAKDEGFDVTTRKISAHETQAIAIIKNARSQGQVDFDDVRVSVQERLGDAAFAKRVGEALSARFCEIVVDEAQDCNPADLAIVNWLRRSEITVKVICDPHQSIYEFRGGVTNELYKFAATFDPNDQLPMSGNFRSTPAICAAIVALRPPSSRSNPDNSVGPYRNDTTPVHIISYSGGAVSPAIGSTFQSVVEELGIPLQSAPVLASTRNSACKAIGQPTIKPTSHMTIVLAEAAMNYHFAFAVGNRRDALVNLHRVILLVQGRISSLGGYHTYLASEGLEDGGWRPEVIALAHGLRFNPTDKADQWLERARELLAKGLIAASSIKQRLRAHGDLATALDCAPANSPPARTIHSAKGLEFPAVCVVMTTKTAAGILDLLEGNASDGQDEEARKIYVGASRAERLLVIAIPKSRASRLQALLGKVCCPVKLHQI
ncbi:ATP-dependent helicase [Bradyrhizobium sp. Ash2021]|uniref:ATP-dependent helicase n=1 Tax=Bradyrhizobium sp. Ash2021 TaxID=2954771 RepID=UPI002815ECA5|nr:ATP-dependent helicase [Bradyrhizobium sp. Ash2021]WMT79051.1 ATP-dependent helicase [Bradyrhizobium sp. Ash2021]